MRYGLQSKLYLHFEYLCTNAGDNENFTIEK